MKNKSHVETKKAFFKYFPKDLWRNFPKGLWKSFKRHYNKLSYHNLDHLEFMFKNKPKVNYEDQFDLAILFHDYFKDEHSSIDMLRALNSYCNIKDTSIAEMLIESTINHRPTTPNKEKIIEDQISFIKLDLEIFNCKKKVVLAYDSKIRKEYKDVPIDIYKENRLKKLLKLKESAKDLNIKLKHLDLLIDNLT